MSSASSLLLDIEVMRTRELKNLLLQRLHCDPGHINKVLDRDELRRLAKKLVMENPSLVSSSSTSSSVSSSPQPFQRPMSPSQTWWQLIVLLILLLLSLLYVGGFSFGPNAGFKWKNVWKFIKSQFYRAAKRVEMAVTCFHEAIYLGGLSLLIANLVEVYGMIIQFSSLLSWILPAHSIIMVWLTSLPRISVPLSALMNTMTSSKMTSFATSTSSSFGIDVGPMLTIWLCIWLTNQLENIGAGRLQTRLFSTNRKEWKWNSSDKKKKQSKDNSFEKQPKEVFQDNIKDDKDELDPFEEEIRLQEELRHRHRSSSQVSID